MALHILDAIFTFHNVSINSEYCSLFLEGLTVFTFHNVSINSGSISVTGASTSTIYIP